MSAGVGGRLSGLIMRCEAWLSRVSGSRAWLWLKAGLLVVFAAFFGLRVWESRGALAEAFGAIVRGEGSGLGLAGLLAAEAALWAVGMALSGLRWRCLARGSGLAVGLREAFVTEYAAQSLAYLTPLGLGEHYARLSVGGEVRGRVSASLGTVAAQWAAVLSLGLVGLWLSAAAGLEVPWGLCVGGVSAVMLAAGGAYVLRRGGRQCILGAMGYAILREFALALQMTLLLCASQGDGSYLGEGAALSLVYYMYLQYVPAMGLLDVCPKGGVGLLVFGSLFGEGAVLAATVCLWGLNCALPTAVWLMLRAFGVGSVRRGCR